MAVKKVGSVYAEIRADIKKLQQDFDKAHGITQASAKKIQDTLDKGVSFDKMAADALKMGASIYGVFRVVEQAIESAKIGSALEKQSKSFANLADAAGTSSKKILDSLKQSSQGLVAESDLMAAAGKAMLMSIPADKISELMKIAAATSKMTGQTMTEAFSDITMGVARQSKMILDNLGIIVDVDKANQDYARSLGKTAEALSDTEKRQSFMNAVLKSGDDMIKRLGASSGELDGINKALAGQKNLWDEISKSTAHFLDAELAAYGGMVDAITVKLKDLRESGSTSDRNKEQFLINQNRMHERLGLKPAGSTAAMQAKFNTRWVGASEAELAAQRSHQEWQRPDPMASWREREGNYAANTEEQNKQLIKEHEELIKKIADEAKKAEDAIKSLHVEVKKLEDEFSASKIFSGESSNYERMQAQLRSGSELSDMEARRIETESEAWAKEAASWNQNLMDKVAEYEKTHKKLTDLSERTAEAMQSNFSNLFFDAMTGKLKTLEDYAKAVFDSIARMASDVAAQQLTRGLFGPEMKGGGWLSSIAGMFGGGAGNMPINQPGFAGAETFHAGGTVGVTGGALRAIPASYFATAPRLHQGLAADEVPAILQKGERVIPKGGAKNNPVVHMHFYSQSGKYDRESISQAQSGLYASLSRANRRNS